jgi:hypothetical protein
MRLLRSLSAEHFPTFIFLKTFYTFKWQLYEGLKRGCKCFY